MKKKVYIYPVTNRFKAGLDNPYLRNLMDSMEYCFEFINRPFPSDTGFFNFIRFFFRADYIFFNWIEDLPDKKFGLWQTRFLYVICRVFQWKGGKIVWTLHNKLSHYTRNMQAKKKLLEYLIKNSDYILTHSEDGRKFIEQKTKVAKNIMVLPHPVISNPVLPAAQPEYDILIWGTLTEYKAVDKFLEFLKTDNPENKYCIMIVGKITDPAYEKLLRTYENDKIRIRNEFISKKTLKNLVADSRYTLFTYHTGSVLSSGALMDAVGFESCIIGPSVAAFKELAEKGIILTYQTFKDIPRLIDNHVKPPELKNIAGFVKENSWEKFSEKMKKWLQE